MPDVIVIGAGVIGAAIARSLAGSGAAVIVVDQGEVADGTSSASFSVDITTRKTPREYFDLSRAGSHRHAELAAALGDDTATWYHPTTTYEWGATDRDRSVIRERVTRLQDWGYPAEWMDHADLTAAEPALEVSPDEARQIAVYPAQAWYDAPVFARAMAIDAVRHGARILTGHRVTALSRSGDRLRSVITNNGIELAADMIVNCAGPAADAVAALAGLTLPLLRIPGLVATTEPLPGHRLDSVVMLPSVNLRPAGAGRLVIHSYPVDAALEPEQHGHVLDQDTTDLLEHARRIVPGLRQHGLQRSAIGIRPVTPDGLPTIGFLDENFYTVSTHSAAHLAPALAPLAAEEILGTRTPHELAPFRPDRPTAANPPTSAIDESLREMNRQLSKSQ